ncbi:Cytochrome P450 89A2 [Linum grandiflorum]
MVENWFFIILVSFSIAFLLKSFINLFSSSSVGKPSLPPGPTGLPFIGNLLLFRSGQESVLRSLHAKYGSTIATHIGRQPTIFIADRVVAHRALVQNGAVFSDRPDSPMWRILSSDLHTIGALPYGPKWRLLRRNLAVEILHPSRMKTYSHARAWILELLKSRIIGFGSEPVRVVESFRYVMYCLFTYICFGDKLEEKQILEIEEVVRRIVLNFPRFSVFEFAPAITRILLSKRWSEFLRMWKDVVDVMLPLIRSRKRKLEEEDQVTSYVDTLLNLELPDEKRKLTETEIASLCYEFLSGGTDTTSNALHWIMANLVKYPDIQTKLLDEIKSLVGETRATEIKEEDLQKLPYLKAVVLEGLRRHPPGHLLMPHAVSLKAELGVGGYSVPKGATVNFMVAEMGLDPEVWEDPMVFKPERFLDSTKPFDITSSKEIKMIPFGAGRRMCPGYELALLHLEYFVANLVWSFEWKEVPGKEVDLSGEELSWFAEVMKNPLMAHVSPRSGVH